MIPSADKRRSPGAARQSSQGPPYFAREYYKVALHQPRAPTIRAICCACASSQRIDRERRNVEPRIRLARFPQTKSLDTFDFAA